MSEEFVFTDNTPDQTAELLGRPKRTTDIKLAILAKFQSMKIGESFNAPTPIETKGASQLIRDVAFCESVTGYLSVQAKNDGKSIKIHPAGSKIVIGKTVKKARRSGGEHGKS